MVDLKDFYGTRTTACGELPVPTRVLKISFFKGKSNIFHETEE